MTIKAVLFDLDGILVDYADSHFHAFNRALREVNAKPVCPDERDTYEGLSTRQKLASMVEAQRLDEGLQQQVYDLKQRYTVELAAEQLVPDRVKTYMVKRLRREVGCVGCVSNCIRASVDLLLSVSALRSFMHVTVSNEDAERPKPYPDPYRLACERLGLAPGSVMAVEDHDRGVTAAREAGCHVVQLTYQTANYMMVARAIKETS